MYEHSALTQVILESLESRAVRHGDEFAIEGDRVRVRCLEPQKHANGDAHPSAVYSLGKYIVCPVCGLKVGEKRLAEMLGIGVVEAGLTLTELARVKQLPVEHLQSWGWRTQRGRDGLAKVLIPWYDEQGVNRRAPAYHIRHYINKDDEIGPRFTWDLPKGVKLQPYGAWRIPEWLDAAEVLGISPYIWIVESELDGLTLWHHDIPATATGGTNSWKPEWAAFYKGFSRIFICQEPGQAGQEMVRLVGESLVSYFESLKEHSSIQISEVLAVPFPEEAKDANGLHLQEGGVKEEFHRRLVELVSRAFSVNKLVHEIRAGREEEARRSHKEHVQRLRESAGPLLEDPSVLHRAIHAVEGLGVVGERCIIGLVRLAVRSRSLARPVNLELNSPSSSGKTYIVTTALRLEAPDAYYELTASTEKALIYLNEPLEHRVIYIQEPEGLAQGVGAAAMKSLVWEGRLKYDSVIKQQGEFVGHHVEKDGPTGLNVSYG